MTRKDYVAIAQVIRSRAQDTLTRPLSGAVAIEQLAEDISEILARDNPRFDRARFLKACGVQS